MTLQNDFFNNLKSLDKSWLKIFLRHRHINDIEKILNKLKHYNFYPELNNVFNAFKYFSVKETKIVILDIEPYNIKNLADGFAFSTLNTNTRPDKLQVIFDTLKSNNIGFVDNKNSLISWAEKGVLLLNTSLTISKINNKSHNKLWKNIIIDVIATVSRGGNTVFLLWGKRAQIMKQYISLQKNNLILEATHPSESCFVKKKWNCNHFKLINKTIIPGFNWSL